MEEKGKEEMKEDGEGRRGEGMGGRRGRRGRRGEEGEGQNRWVDRGRRWRSQ